MAIFDMWIKFYSRFVRSYWYIKACGRPNALTPAENGIPEAYPTLSKGIKALHPGETYKSVTLLEGWLISEYENGSNDMIWLIKLTLSWQWYTSYRNKSKVSNKDWFLYDSDQRHERVKL